MKHKTYTSFLNTLILLALFAGIELTGHGFAQGTLIKTSKDGWWPIEQVCQLSCQNKNQKVASYNPQLNRWVTQRVKSAGKSETNCCFRIGFDDNRSNDIVCTPTQEFYRPSTAQWIPAYKLKTGDMLLSQHDKSIQITHVEFIKKPIKVYSLEIKKTHNFLVGHYSILTHNMVLPMAFCAALNVPFGGVIGGAIGSFLGPITIGIGVSIGTIIGLAVKAIYEDRIPTYQIPTYNTAIFEANFKDNVQTKPTGCFNPDLETNKPHIHVTPIENPLPKKEIGCIAIEVEYIGNQIPNGYSKDDTLERNNISICFQPTEQNEQTVLYVQQKTPVIEDVKVRYQGPTARNWKEFERDCPIGQEHGEKFINTGKQNPKDGAPIRQLIEDIPGTEIFKKGYQFAPDRAHKGDHFEVWDKKGNWIGVANLDGSKNHEKTNATKNKDRRNLT